MRKRIGAVAVAAMATVAWLAGTAVIQAQAQPAARGGTSKVAVVDIVRVFDTFEQTIVLNKKLDMHTRMLGEEAERRAKAAQAEQEALQAFAPDSAEWYKQNEKVKKMIFENEVWRQLERENIAESHKRWVLRTYEMVTQEIERVATAHGVDIVITRERLKGDVGDSKALLAQILNIKVVYASSDPSVDLTDEVLLNLNSEFQKRGGAASVEFAK